MDQRNKSISLTKRAMLKTKPQTCDAEICWGVIMLWSDWVVVGQKAAKVTVLKKAKSAIAELGNARLKVLQERRARADELVRVTREALGYGGKDHAGLNAIVERLPRIEPIDAITAKPR